MVLGSKGIVWFQTLSRYSLAFTIRFLLMVKFRRPTQPQIRQKARNLFHEMVLCFFIYGTMMVFIATFFWYVLWYVVLVQWCAFEKPSFPVSFWWCFFTTGWALCVGGRTMSWHDLEKDPKSGPCQNPDFCYIDVFASFCVISQQLSLSLHVT